MAAMAGRHGQKRSGESFVEAEEVLDALAAGGERLGATAPVDDAAKFGVGAECKRSRKTRLSNA